MKNLLIGIAITSLLLAACTPQPQEQTTSSAQTVEAPATENEWGIELDHGKKWKVNNDMMIHIQNLENEMNAFKGSSQSEMKSLAGQVNHHLNELTSSCTMSGQAHDELHKWLVPFLDLAHEFEHAENETAAASKLTDIKQQMEVFHNYFE